MCQGCIALVHWGAIQNERHHNVLMHATCIAATCALPRRIGKGVFGPINVIRVAYCCLLFNNMQMLKNKDSTVFALLHLELLHSS